MSKVKNNSYKNSVNEADYKGNEKSKNNSENQGNTWTADDLEELELLNEQIVAAVLGIYAQLLFYKGGYEEREELYKSKEKQNKDQCKTKSDYTFLESARYFLISQLIFTKVSFQFYYLLLKQNKENNTSIDLDSERKINISCILNSLGNIYFLYGIQEAIDRGDTEPTIGD